MIQRDFQSNEIVDSFLSDNPSYQVCMITGIRGSGKTVALTTISKRLENLGEWVVINLNPERDLIHDLTCELCNKKEFTQIFKKAKINISTFGLDIELSKADSLNNDIVILRKVLKSLNDRGKKY